MANAVQERRARRKAAKSNSSSESKRSNDPVAKRRRNRIDTEKQAKPVDARAKAKEAESKRSLRKKSDPMSSSVDAITQRATAKYKKPNVDTFSDMGSSRRKIKTIDVKPDTKKDPMASSVDAITQRALSKVKKKEEPKKPEAKSRSRNPTKDSADVPRRSPVHNKSLTEASGYAYDKDLMDSMTKKGAPAAKAKPTSTEVDTDAMSFGKAFNYFRGKRNEKGEMPKVFTWRGKKYTTQRQDEQIAAEKMYKGGYRKKTKKAAGGMLNGKKPRTGSMDYRKGGLFR